ncbi:hypothetical protein STA1M1_22190 [Sinisalibacter aestuarii]|uniref:Serine aminopeptidase S33 domain-containing protein n=1 Tax=Sinisalibacter aestuarii TaxID=2949426 RepID=A0ABQ5LTN2_9RHOB|nr:hypothetical protein STA1M1_22190 [Sinisalibacter aestuarii]
MLYPFTPLRDAPPAGLSETTLTTADGETLVMWSAPPAPGKPVVLYFHGNAGNLAMRAGRFAAFTARGFGVVAPGYRGSSGSSGKPTEATLIDDARMLAAQLPALTGPAPVIYYGESLGAAVAIALAETSPPAALVLEAPFTSLAGMSARLYGSAALARLLTSRWPSLERIANVPAPLLILHGADDPLVPPAMSRSLLAAAPGPDKRLYLVPGAGHVDVWQADAQRELYAFLARF